MVHNQPIESAELDPCECESPSSFIIIPLQRMKRQELETVHCCGRCLVKTLRRVQRAIVRCQE